MAKILVIDDEPSILNLVAAYLKPEGCEVHTAMDGPPGLKASRAFKPDLIILDIMLPGMDGSVEAHTHELDFRPLNVSSLVKTVAKRLASQAESKLITLNLELAPDLPHILADEDRATQVLTNLTANALRYTPERGTVIISAKQVNNEVQISVRDTGIGIPPEHLANIFYRFYRVDKSRSRQSGGGSGSGLTIARALIEAHRGRIWAESAGNGQGSIFTFTLPIER